MIVQSFFFIITALWEEINFEILLWACALWGYLRKIKDYVPRERERDIMRDVWGRVAARSVSTVRANRRRCYCSSEPLSLQSTVEGQWTFPPPFCECDFAGETPEQTPSKSLCRLMHIKSENRHNYTLFIFKDLISEFPGIWAAC